MGDFLGLIWNSFWHLLLNILVAINAALSQVINNGAVTAGVSIIIFTLFMRLLTVPLTMKSLRSSRNMQQIQPLIKEVQRKYGKDKQKQQEEMMKLYQEYGINPAAGCFPMLVQLPIFIGLYSALIFTLQHGNNPAMMSTVLWNSDWAKYGNFNQPFMWISSLAAADPWHVWPILSGIFQFVQSRMSMPRRDPNQPMDSQQRIMQNLMQFMPVYIVFISWAFPAGTVIYWAFSSLFGAVQQYFITGFGTLPDLPGMGWLPRKPIQPPKPIQPLPEDQRSRRKGIMARMMEAAQSAQQQQEQQKEGGEGNAKANGVTAPSQKRSESALGVTASGSKIKNISRPAKNISKASKYSSEMRKAAGRSELPGNGAADEEYESNGAEDGLEESAYASDRVTSAANAPAQLPRKRRNKR